MADSSLLIEQEAPGITSVILNRPQVGNAFDGDTIAQLLAALDTLRQDSGLRVLLLRAQGKHFSAGADLNWMKQSAALSYQENLDDATQLAALFKNLNEFPVPTIALINGAAYGGAGGLTACCDIALAADNAKFCFSEVRLGILPATISPYVIAAIGARNARRYFLSAEVIEAELAMRLGLVHQVVPKDELLAGGLDLAAGIANNGPRALAATKAMIQQVEQTPLNDELIRYTAELIAQRRASAEGQEGLSAFFAKRKADWTVE